MLRSVAVATETTRALGNCAPVTEILGLLIPSAYAGGTNLVKAVLDLPQRGFPKLLQLPSIVRYLESSQTDSLKQNLFRSVFCNEYCKSPSLACSFVRLNLLLKTKF
jgi:hypothetical protein